MLHGKRVLSPSVEVNLSFLSTEVVNSLTSAAPVATGSGKSSLINAVLNSEINYVNWRHTISSNTCFQ